MKPSISVKKLGHGCSYTFEVEKGKNIEAISRRNFHKYRCLHRESKALINPENFPCVL